MEPKSGRHFTSVTPTRDGAEFAGMMKQLADAYPEAETIHLVMDNLSTHTEKSLTRRYGVEIGQQLWKRFTVHYTPVHGSWLNQAEIEISVMARQCLGKLRMGSVEKLRSEVRAWNRRSNRVRARINWTFDRRAARRKFNYTRYLSSGQGTRLHSSDATESRLREEIGRMRQHYSDEARTLREELAEGLRRFSGQTDQRAEALRTAVTRQLEQVRLTVDEKLQQTLETRLGESFRIVSERLEQVHKGLGEMQNLASGVGDLKRVLSNVTTRGAWGEVQLENLLNQMLAPDQFARNVSPTGSGERVEFAIKMPGHTSTVWLPIDAKFPSETYQRLAAAAERCDTAGVETYARELETVIRASAKTFSEKYLAPPHTTDFGILFLATEGLYAEALRRPGLVESLQSDYRVVLAGPTTFAALLNSLQMGFRTLAIQQRSGEVWKLLGDVKTQFGKYSQVLDAIRKRLEQATQTVDDAAIRTRVIERKLKSVETSNDEDEDRVIRLANVG